MDFVAQYLGMPPIAVYEVASFYDMYDLEPVGRYKLSICTNLPCALSGATEAAEHLKQQARRRTGTRPPPTAASRSRKASASAPAATRRCAGTTTRRMLIGMTPKKLDRWIEELDK